ncbi:MFP1 attachment factor 1-like [Cornus florida]|uniref:MFP1 attachment factor 1-like n=1 Tax=Cornus florida TaxID=4283 RepID=UPI00289D3084|nr:MFP1 attachment factor 1-like [Cornus florida]
MSDENSSIVEEQEPKPSTMSETEETQQHEIKHTDKTNKPFSIWPPSQRTRDAVVNRLIETLSTPSVLSKRYGSVPHDEAAAAARRIEDEAFAAARGCGLDEDIEILQVYSKDISKRMLEVVKSRSASASTPDSSGTVDPTSTASEETSSVEHES